ncbi:hypothetical protein FRB90_003159 [Tulasnella sp. 427]|nr:hypothetical protein FRB90_003159 [Tulasnella sp. 427]
MASTLQTQVSLDFETALGKFVTNGPIKTQVSLEDAVFELLLAMQTADGDVSTLLATVIRKINGLLEVVMTSRNDLAFIFRGRVMKSIQKAPRAPHPTLTTCAERLGIFFLRLPHSIKLDQDVITKHFAFSARLALPDAPQDYFVAKKEKPASPVSPTFPKLPKPGKQKTRYVPLDLYKEEPTPSKRKRSASAQASFAPPLSPTTPINPSATAPTASLSEQLKECIEAYFVACLEDGVQEFAVQNLLAILNPPPPVFPSPPVRRLTISDHTVASEARVIESSHRKTKSLTANTLAQHDIARYLGETTKSTLGDWPIIVSQRGIKHFRQYIAREKQTFTRIEKVIRQLSMGGFSESNRTNLLDQDYGVPIYTADLGGNLRLVYQIDFGAPTGASSESQFIRIFGVYQALEIDVTFWQAVAVHLGGRGKEYVRRTEIDHWRFSPHLDALTDLNLGFVRSAPILCPRWSTSQQKCRTGMNREQMLKSTKPTDLTFIVFFHWRNLCRSRILSSMKFNEASFMFSVAPPENQIIKYPSSCLVLGRSGTGKTTCMVFRMIGLDVAAKKSGQILRQVFVTQSRTLARKVRLYCAQLMQTETDIIQPTGPKASQGLSLLDIDENAEEEGVLPAKFSELEERHFPLFVTYDQLCKLLEADFNMEFVPSPLPTSKTTRTRSKKASTARQPLISFHYFDSKIWPHMDHRLKRGLHSALVYSEFMGIIKGSEASLNKSRHHLDQTDYESQNNRSLSGDSTERSRVYTLFEAYHKLRPTASYDIADRVHILAAALRDRGVPGKPIDFLYVDEAQDNLIIDAALLRNLCPNPHGLFFAGDTAQTISVGSAFRFSELKAFLYRLEREDAHVKRGGRPPVDPHFFQLSTNYRSHSGIVNAAAYVVRLLDSYFQYSIDSLAPEVAHVDVTTHKPLFFSGMRNQADFLRLITNSKSGKVELGAQQGELAARKLASQIVCLWTSPVIIVRDEKAVSDLKETIGRVGVVLTLYESKGMEFNDVLLYNFFTDSSATDTDWRAMLFAEQEGRHLNSQKHSILQSELKSFYVGLTRARERVWIWEETDNGFAMENLLVNNGLATSHKPDATVPQVATTSHEDEWAEQAKEYFSKSLYLEAEFCFRKAQMSWWASVAQAYDRRQEAMQLPEKHPDRAVNLLEVAQLFDTLAQDPERTESPETIRLLFLNAAESYVVILDHVRAALAFRRAGKYTQAAYHYRVAGEFDEAIDVIKNHFIEPELAESITYAAKKARKLCSGKEEFIEFLQDNGFEEQCVTFLDSVAEHEEAASLLWEAGDHLSAIARFRQSRKLSSRQKASQCLLDGLRGSVSFASNYKGTSKKLSDLLALIREEEMSLEEVNEVNLFRAIIAMDQADLDDWCERYFDSDDVRCALLALDAWTQTGAPESIEVATPDDVARILRRCEQFGWAVNFVVRDTDFISLPEVQTMFGISSTEQGAQAEDQDITSQSVVHPYSFVFAVASNSVHKQVETSDPEPVTLPKDKVDELVRRTLLERLNALVENVDTLSRRSRAFEVCTKFLTSKSCNGHSDNSCKRDHVLERDLTVHQFNSRFRIHILSIALVDYWTAFDGSVNEERNRVTKQKIWISRLFRLCYPSNLKLGNLSDITPDLIPEYSSAIPVVKTWLQEVFRSLRPGEQRQYFMTNLLTTCLLATAFDYSDAVTYLWRGQWSMDQELAKKDGLIQERDDRPVAGTAIAWFAQGTLSRTNLGVHTLGNMLTGRVWIEVGAAVAFAEEVCSQLILTEYYNTLTAYDGLTLPRSWIIRAFSRAPSYQRNGSITYELVKTLRRFLQLMLLKEDPGEYRKLMMQGKAIKEATPPARSIVIARLCRCLALRLALMIPAVGHNLVRTKESILGIFKELGVPDDPLVRTDYHGYATASNWNEVARALRASLSFSTHPLDEFIIIRQRMTKMPSLVGGMRTIFCPDERRLLKKLQLVDASPTIALQSEILMPDMNRGGSSNAEQKTQSQQINPENGQEEDIQLESESYTEDDHKCARIIQAVFRRHKQRTRDPIRNAYHDLAKRLVGDPEGPSPHRHLLLCLRGPLPDVLAYLRVLHNLCLAVVANITKEMQNSDHEMLEELREKKDDLRSIHREVKRITKDLHPSSGFYSRGSPRGLVSTSAIVDRVGLIPELVRRISDFTDCPTDNHYDDGVEPILSNRTPWITTNDPEN